MRDKHQVNVKKNSLVNFQIGLIAALAFVYIMFEVFTTSNEIIVADKFSIEEVPEEWPEKRFTIEKPKPEQKKVAKLEKPKVQKKSEELKIVDDNLVEELNEFINDDESEEEIVDEGLDPGEINEAPDKEPIIDKVPFIAVEFAPVYPGCDRLKTNKERSVCFQEKIQRMITKKFNSGLGPDLGLEGRQRISVIFEIGKDGNVTNIQARAVHPRLEKEAVRVVKLLPKMKPGMQRDTPVAVQYSLPIVFDVR